MLPENQTLEDFVGYAHPGIPENQTEIKAWSFAWVMPVVLEEGGLKWWRWGNVWTRQILILASCEKHEPTITTTAWCELHIFSFVRFRIESLNWGEERRGNDRVRPSSACLTQLWPRCVWISYRVGQIFRQRGPGMRTIRRTRRFPHYFCSISDWPNYMHY